MNDETTFLPEISCSLEPIPRALIAAVITASTLAGYAVTTLILNGYDALQRRKP